MSLPCRLVVDLVLALVVVLPAASCAPPPEPDEDAGPAVDRADLDAAWQALNDDVKALAVPLEKGALAGTFAARSSSATIVDTVFAGYQTGGGVNYRLVTRSYDDEAGHYVQESRLCGGYNYEVSGVTLFVPEETYRKVPPSTEEVVRVDDERGLVLADGHLQLWALRDLPDPFETPLPETAEEAMEPPHSERIYDMDDDGNPGMTMDVTGAVTAEVYAIQRKRFSTTGVVTSADESVGFVDTLYDALVLGGDNSLLEYADPSRGETHPDPNESVYQELRLADGDDCADVMARVEAGDFDERARWAPDDGGA